MLLLSTTMKYFPKPHTPALPLYGKSGIVTDTLSGENIFQVRPNGKIRFTHSKHGISCKKQEVSPGRSKESNFYSNQFNMILNLQQSFSGVSFLFRCRRAFRRVSGSLPERTLPKRLFQERLPQSSMPSRRHKQSFRSYFQTCRRSRDKQSTYFVSKLSFG